MFNARCRCSPSGTSLRSRSLLHAIWTDERISASCVSMKNTDQIRENADAARRYEPVKTTDILQLRDAVLAAGPNPLRRLRRPLLGGRRHRGRKLGNLTRFLTYHEHHGHRTEARRQFAAMTDTARNWAGADLEAAREACPGKLDFAKLLPEVDRHLA